MVMRKAFSYIRFSTAEQQKGDSLRRQRAARDEFIARHNEAQTKKEKEGGEPDFLQLDDQLLDLGRSAYKGEHLTNGGALGAFLERIRLGEIKPGSVLIVEHLDRLGRMEVVDQLEIFLGIIRSGVEVVTLTDGMWFSRERVRADQTALLISIIRMTQSFEESDKKAKRLAAVWEAKRQQIGQGKAVTAVCPGWIRLNETGDYELIGDRVILVREIFARTLIGHGKRTIARDFNIRKVPTWGVKGKAANGWHDSYIQKILHNDSVIGIFHPHTTLHLSGHRVPVGKPVENFYPPVIDLKTWQAAQSLRKSSPGRRASTVKNLFIGITKDGVYGCTMNFVDKGGSKNGRWQYLVSDRRRTHPEEEHMRWKYRDFEDVFLRAMLDYDWQQNDSDPEIFRLESALVALENQQTDLNKQGKNIAKAIAGGADVAFINDEMREIEKLLLDVKRKLKETQSELQARKTAQQMLRPLDGVNSIYDKRDDQEMRSKLRLEIRQRISRIDLFSNGTVDAKEQPILPEPWDLRCQIQQGFKVTLINGVQVWVFPMPDKIAVVELPPLGQAVVFWQMTRTKLNGWEFFRGFSCTGVKEFCKTRADQKTSGAAKADDKCP